MDRAALKAMHWQEIKDAAISGRIESESLPVLEDYLLHMNSTQYGFDKSGREFADSVKARIERAIKLLRDAEATNENTRLHTAALNHSERLHGKSMCVASWSLGVAIAALILAGFAWQFPRNSPVAENQSSTSLKEARPEKRTQQDLPLLSQTNSSTASATNTSRPPQTNRIKAPQ